LQSFIEEYFCYFLSFETIVLTIESNARLGQQQNFFCENQHVAPSPFLFSKLLKHPSGHELPIKQNGAIPYHLHNASLDIGVKIKMKINTKYVRKNKDEAISR
jgi:hypothetical protein